MLRSRTDGFFEDFGFQRNQINNNIFGLSVYDDIIKFHINHRLYGWVEEYLDMGYYVNNALIEW